MKLAPSNTDTCCDSADALSASLAALAHPARVAILQRLAQTGPCNCKQVVGNFDLAQSTVSQHLKVLVEAGLLNQRPQSQQVIYQIDAEAVARLAEAVSGLAAQCCVQSKSVENTNG